MEQAIEPESLGQLCCMNEEGDKRIMWNKGDADEVNAARAMFDDFKKRGYMAYRTTGKGQGEVIDKFDPSVERIVMRPNLIGG